MNEAEKYIDLLGMKPHHKHRYYVRSGRSTQKLNFQGHSGERAYWDSIYYLMEPSQILRLHKLSCDELWFYHDGDSILLEYIDQDGNLVAQTLGPDLENGERPFISIPAGVIFGAQASWDRYTLMSCVTVPGLEDPDFELVDRDEMLEKYPALHDIILRLTY